MNSYPRISTFHYRKFNVARKMVLSVFLRERHCGVVTAQCGKCQQGQWQPWAVAAVGGSVVVGPTARHQDGDSVGDGMVSRRVIGSSSVGGR